ncbi:MAG: hypothetical protein ACR2NN_27550 [Bryobacteraceae bacterium]
MLFSSALWTLIIHAHSLEIARGRVVHMLMWSPALAAFLTCAIFRIDIITLGWNWRPARYEVAGYFLPLLYGSIAYIPLGVTGFGKLRFSEFVNAAATSLHLTAGQPFSIFALDLALLGSFGVIQSLASARFSVMIVATGTMAAWLRLRSGSLWPAAILHASHNLFIQSVFDPLTVSAII